MKSSFRSFAAGRPRAQAAYGTATGHVFAISAAVALLGVLAAVLLKPVTLRTSLQVADPVKAAVANGGAPDLAENYAAQ